MGGKGGEQVGVRVKVLGVKGFRLFLKKCQLLCVPVVIAQQMSGAAMYELVSEDIKKGSHDQG